MPISAIALTLLYGDAIAEHAEHDATGGARSASLDVVGT